MKLHKIDKSLNISSKGLDKINETEGFDVYYELSVKVIRNNYLKADNRFTISSFNVKFFAGLSLLSLLFFNISTIVVFSILAISMMVHYIIRKKRQSKYIGMTISDSMYDFIKSAGLKSNYALEQEEKLEKEKAL